MKKYNFILLVFIFTSCGGEMTKEEANNKIQECKSQISELNNQITDLEKITKANKNDSTSAKALRISVQEISSTNFDHFFTSSANLESVKSAFISPEMNGQVKKIYIKEGVFVKKGQLLVSLNSSVLRSSLVELETALGLAEIVFKKQSDLWEKKIGSEIEYLKAKNNKESLENKISSLKAQIELTKVKAPISGIIDAVNIKVGEMAMPGQPIISLVNLDKMYVNANVSESYISSLTKGDEVSITFPTYPELNIESKIYRIGNIIAAGNRTVKVQVLINNTNNKLKPNMVAHIKFNDYNNKSAISIPSIIIRNDLQGAYVYVVENENGKNIASKRYITTGKSNNENTIITKNLVEGEKVITEGYNLVKNGTEVKF